ncbi:MAG TPA: hypothetical protein VH561_04980 [Micromonosporaceae bacterium]|jgi:hypothetical protein
MEDSLCWDDVLPVVEPYMCVWSGGSELRWGEYAWHALACAGLTSFDTELGRTEVVLRALALAALSRDFYARTFGDGSDGDWRSAITADLVGPAPFLDAFTLGQLAERRRLEVDNRRWNSDAIGHVLRDLVDREYPTVAEALGDVLGDATLFASLLSVRGPEVTYPVADSFITYVMSP